MVAEAEIVIITFLWASFILPFVVMVFGHVWNHLLLLADQQDACAPRSQRALRRLAARYKPKIRRLPYWIRRRMQTLAMASTVYDGGGPISSRFDSDSVKIGIDNHATRSLSPNLHHF